MDHLSERDMIKLIGGELPVDRLRQIEAHLERCEQCRLRRDAMLSVDRLLGEWTVDSAGRDMLGAIQSRLAEDTRSFKLPMQRDRLRRVGRIAAAIAVGIGLGHAVGRFAKPSGSFAPTVVATADDQALADELGLYVLESPASAGLFTTVLDMTEVEDDEDSEGSER